MLVQVHQSLDQETDLNRENTQSSIISSISHHFVWIWVSGWQSITNMKLLFQMSASLMSLPSGKPPWRHLLVRELTFWSLEFSILSISPLHVHLHRVGRRSSCVTKSKRDTCSINLPHTPTSFAMHLTHTSCQSPFAWVVSWAGVKSSSP